MVTGGPPVRGGGRDAHLIVANLLPASVLRTTGAGSSGKTSGIVGRLPTYRFAIRKSVDVADLLVAML